MALNSRRDQNEECKAPSEKEVTNCPYVVWRWGFIRYGFDLLTAGLFLTGIVVGMYARDPFWFLPFWAVALAIGVLSQTNFLNPVYYVYVGQRFRLKRVSGRIVSHRPSRIRSVTIRYREGDYAEGSDLRRPYLAVIRIRGRIPARLHIGEPSRHVIGEWALEHGIPFDDIMPVAGSTEFGPEFGSDTPADHRSPARSGTDMVGGAEASSQSFDKPENGS